MCMNRKQQLSTQANELEALEARIREMEQRLKNQHGQKEAGRPSGSPRSQRPPVANAFGDVPPQVPEKDNRRPTSRTEQEQKYAGSRPGTARAGQQAVPGALPPTPVASEGEHELVEPKPDRS